MNEKTRVYLNRNHCEDLLRVYHIPYMFMLRDAKREEKIKASNPSGYQIYVDWLKYRDEYDRIEREENDRKGKTE